MQNTFKGLITALITPFKNYKIDFKALEILLTKQIEAEVNGVVIAGTTGEAPALNNAEHLEVISKAVEFCRNKIPVFAGVGSNNTAQAIFMSKEVEKLGVDGIMSVVPYYNRPTQNGLYEHFKLIANSTGLPVMVYNVPKRTGCDISNQTMLRLCEFSNIVAIKDASGDLERPLELKSLLGSRLKLLAGDDILALAFNAQGGEGCVSVASNIVPKLCVELQKLWQEGKITEAQELNLKLFPLYKALFVETNPIIPKYMLSLMGLSSSELRLPLCEPSIENKTSIKQTLKELGLI